MTARNKGEALPAIKDVLTEVQARHKELDALDTEVSKLIKRIEDGMRKHFSVRVWTIITDDQEREQGWQVILAYGKAAGKWQLLAESGPVDDADRWDSTPLLSSPREMRARCLHNGHIEQLLRDAGKQLAAELVARRAAVEAGKMIADSLDDDGIPF